MARRRSSRRSRRRGRRHGRHNFGFAVLLLFAVATALGGERAVFVLVEMGTGLTLFLLLALSFAAVQAGRHIAGRFVPGAAIPRQRSAPVAVTRAAEPGEQWTAARGRFDALREEYAAYECDALAVLRLPALADVTVPATARFVHAFAEAQALDTDTRPPPDHLSSYVEAVDSAGRAWRAARDAAERIRLAGLSPAERASVQRVVKLLTMAGGTGNDAERQAAYAKARDELLRLERSGTISLPRPARFALDDRARGRLSA
jgi:hypothetical protein